MARQLRSRSGSAAPARGRGAARRRSPAVNTGQRREQERRVHRGPRQGPDQVVERRLGVSRPASVGRPASDRPALRVAYRHRRRNAISSSPRRPRTPASAVLQVAGRCLLGSQDRGDRQRQRPLREIEDLIARLALLARTQSESAMPRAVGATVAPPVACRRCCRRRRHAGRRADTCDESRCRRLSPRPARTSIARPASTHRRVHLSGVAERERYASHRLETPPAPSPRVKLAIRSTLRSRSAGRRGRPPAARGQRPDARAFHAAPCSSRNVAPPAQSWLTPR